MVPTNDAAVDLEGDLEVVFLDEIGELQRRFRRFIISCHWYRNPLLLGNTQVFNFCQKIPVLFFRSVDVKRYRIPHNLSFPKVSLEVMYIPLQHVLRFGKASNVLP